MTSRKARISGVSLAAITMALAPLPAFAAVNQTPSDEAVIDAVIELGESGQATLSAMENGVKTDTETGESTPADVEPTEGESEPTALATTTDEPTDEPSPSDPEPDPVDPDPTDPTEPEPTEDPTEDPEPDPIDPTDEPTEEPAPTDPPTGPTDPTDPPTEPVDPTDPPTDEPDPTDPPTGPTDPTDPPTEPVDPTDPPTEQPDPTDPPTEQPKPTDPPTDEPNPTDPPTEQPEPPVEPDPVDPPEEDEPGEDASWRERIENVWEDYNRRNEGYGVNSIIPRQAVNAPVAHEEQEPEELPFTGGSVEYQAALAAGLIVAGAGSIHVSRKKGKHAK